MAASQPPQYAVHLESFEGPLDLLLRLIEKAELDITTISLARVTDQYLAYIHQLDEILPDLLADFLVVAAKLILIKSRALLPQPPAPVEEEEEEDVGEGLVRQLEEYRRFKEASLALRQREEQGLHSYVRAAPVLAAPRGLAPGEVTLDDLLAALQRVLAAVPSAPVGTIVPPLIVSIGDKIRAIESAIAGGRRVHFGGLLMRSHWRLEIVVTFLAVLELIKRGTLVAEQSERFGEIHLRQAPPEAPAPDAGTPPGA